MPNILANIELNEKQVKEFNKELNNWKSKTRKQLEEQVKSDIKTEYDVKLREIREEKENFKKEQENLVEEIKEKMQKVMVKRFTGAIKEMYDELKVEARKDVMNDPRITALEEVKNLVYPLMDETVTKGYVDELSNALRMVESREEENDKLKAKIKLKEITANLSPSVAEAVETFIGEATSEEEVVEKYAKLKNLVGEGKKAPSEKSGKYKEVPDDEENVESDEYDDDEEEEEEEVAEEWDPDDYEGEYSDESDDGEGDSPDDYKGKKKKKEKKEESMDEELEINPSFHYNKNENNEKKDEYVQELNEMLKLAGVDIED